MPRMPPWLADCASSFFYESGKVSSSEAQHTQTFTFYKTSMSFIFRFAHLENEPLEQRYARGKGVVSEETVLLSRLGGKRMFGFMSYGQD